MKSKTKGAEAKPEAKSPEAKEEKPILWVAVAFRLFFAGLCVLASASAIDSLQNENGNSELGKVSRDRHRRHGRHLRRRLRLLALPQSPFSCDCLVFGDSFLYEPRGGSVNITVSLNPNHNDSLY